MKVKMTKYGVVVRAQVIVGDWEGDPNVPNGRRFFDPYIDRDSITVETSDGTDITDWMTDEALDELVPELMEVYDGELDARDEYLARFLGERE